MMYNPGKEKLVELLEGWLSNISNEANKYEKMYLINELLERQRELCEKGWAVWTTEYLITRLSKLI